MSYIGQKLNPLKLNIIKHILDKCFFSYCQFCSSWSFGEKTNNWKSKTYLYQLCAVIKCNSY